MILKELKAEIVSLLSVMDNPYLEANLILEKVLNKPISYILFNKELVLTEKDIRRIRELTSMRLSGIPSAYLTEEKEFYGLPFYVNKNVLIPRPDTETLVEVGIEEIKRRNLKEPKILDLCTGSGAIATSISYSLNLDVSFSDISKEALDVAIYNYENITKRKSIYKLGSLLDVWKDYKFDIILSNPPYLTKEWYEETEVEVKKEPYIALVSDNIDGLEIARKIITSSYDLINPSGALIMELDYRQMNQCAKILLECGFTNIRITKDLSGKERVIYGEKPTR